MSLFEKLKEKADLSIQQAKKNIAAVKETYEKEGAEGVGNIAAKAVKPIVEKTKEISDEAITYGKEVKEASIKASNKSAMIYKDDKPIAQTATAIALGTIEAIRKVSLDTKSCLEKKIKPE